MTMEKKRFSRVLFHAPREEVLSMAETIEQETPVTVLRPPAKTLVMLQVREPVKQSRFYLGETVATHCTVQLGDTVGVSVVMGDDFEKTRAMAVLDAAHTAALPALEALAPRLEELETAQQTARRREAARHRKTQVQFRILEDSVQ